MSLHSFKFHYKGKDFYPSVIAVAKNIYKVHFYKSLEEFGLPQQFIFDTESIDVIMVDESTQINADKQFLSVFREALMEHLAGIQQTN